MLMFSGGIKWEHRIEWVNKVSGPQIKTIIKKISNKSFRNFYELNILCTYLQKLLYMYHYTINPFRNDIFLLSTYSDTRMHRNTGKHW